MLRRLAQECAPAHDTLIYFLAYTGLRFGEMASLRLRDVDLDRRGVNVSANVVEISGRPQTDTPKNHRARSVPVPRFLVPALRDPGCRSRPGLSAVHDQDWQAAA